MLCGFCCLISQTRGRRACIITSAAALALSSISGLLSRKITSPAEQWNTGSVVRASAFLLWLLWTSYRKDQEELLQGFEDLQKQPCESVRVCLGFGERNLMTLEQRDVRLHFISSLLPKRVRSGERGVDYQGCLAWGFIFEEFFLPAGILWCSIFLPWTSWQVSHCSGVCGFRAGICLNPRGGYNQMHITLCCLCISGDAFLIESICSVIPHWAFDYTYYPTSLVRCWVLF